LICLKRKIEDQQMRVMEWKKVDENYNEFNKKVENHDFLFHSTSYYIFHFNFLF
jgi:predicted transposase YbfD/YdcC